MSIASTQPVPVVRAAGRFPDSAKKPNFTIVFVMMGIALVLSTMFSMKREDNSLPIPDVSSMPGSLGTWRCVRDQALDPSLMSEMKADSYVDRIYVDQQTGQNVELMLVYRRYGRREFAHRPDQCYPAAGYNIVSKDHTTLPYAGRAVDAIHLVADGRNVQRVDGKVGVPDETLTYFFACGDRTESDFMIQQLLMAVERLIPDKNGWTFIRLSSQHVTNDSDAVAAQQDFMRTYGPSLQRIITTDSSAVSAPAAAPVSASEAFGSFK